MKIIVAVYNMLLLFFCVSVLHAMERLKVRSPNKLEGSFNTYNWGLGEKYEVDWESQETQAFIQAFKNKTMHVDVKNKIFHFSSSYSYPIETAKNKFNIMRTNIELNKITSDLLQCLFFNEDVKYDFSVCKYQKNMYLLTGSIPGKDDSLPILLWSIIGAILRTNRKELHKAFESDDPSQLAEIIKKPLFVEHITLTYVKDIFGLK